MAGNQESTIKNILRIPYRYAKGVYWKGQEKKTALEFFLGRSSMRPPLCKVKKSTAIHRILLPMMKYDYGVKERGLSYEYYNFYQTLLSMGYEVELFDFMTVLQDIGRKRMNSFLWDTVQSYKPDLVFFTLFQEQFDKATVKRISESTPAITLNWFADDEWRFHIFSKFWAPCFNFSTTTYEESVPNYSRLGYGKIILTQWAANESIYRNHKLKRDIDVSFVGASHGNRKSIIEKIEKSGISVQCYGSGWKNGRINQDKMVEIFNRSKINLNLSASSSLSSVQIKGRIFEVPLCGGFLLTDPAPHLEKYFVPGKELVQFSGSEDLIDKIHYYLDKPNNLEKIAEAGYQRSLFEHTYRKRFESIFSKILGSAVSPGDS